MNFKIGDTVKGQTTGIILRVLSLEPDDFTGEIIDIGDWPVADRHVGKVNDGWAYPAFIKCLDPKYKTHESKTVGDLI